MITFPDSFQELPSSSGLGRCPLTAKTGFESPRERQNLMIALYRSYMQATQSIEFLGYASGIAAGDPGCGDGPVVLQKSNLVADLEKQGLQANWQAMLVPEKLPNLPAVAKISAQLAEHTLQLSNQKKTFTVFGGDHTSAIGTWSGVAKAYENQGPIGLIWIDAHLDSHTPETSESGNIHGMPAACLLGYGAKELTNLFSKKPKIKPEHLCFIGIRSYEPGEAALIKRLGIRVYDMQNIKENGIEKILQEAVAHVTKETCGYGITIDLDGIDPADAPGVGTPEPNGIRGQELCDAIAKTIKNDKKLLASEITEFNPHHDTEHKTVKLVEQLLVSLYK